MKKYLTPIGKENMHKKVNIKKKNIGVRPFIKNPNGILDNFIKPIISKNIHA
ncbi:hypothetical protein SCAPIOD60043 [Staphylococcus capitis]|nr:hypothetical protein SCAPIOD60043 [Staphylococcus capitis]